MPRFTTSDGLSLAYEDSGAGLPLLCLPGLTRNARDFDDLKAVLPADLRMIVLTSRGRDPSDYASDPMQYAIPVEARDALELLDHLGIDEAVLIGTSRGGLVSMIIASVAKERLAGVLLNDIGPVIEPVGLERIKEYLGRRPGGRNYADVAAGLKQNMGAEFPTFDDAQWRTLAERWFVEDAGGVGLRYDARLRDAMLAQQAEEDGPPDLWPLFDALEGVPLGVVRGANTDLLSAETLAEMQARRPDLIVATVPDRGHVPLLDEPESIGALERLLEKVRDEQR